MLSWHRLDGHTLNEFRDNTTKDTHGHTVEAPPSGHAKQYRVRVPRGTVLPPPVPGERRVNVRIFGIVVADDLVRDRVDRVFHWPMIVLALAMLPLLLVEFIRKPEGWYQWSLDIGFAIIWLAFVIEFVIKISIAESRIEYARRNWLDLVIILVPVLRPFRAASSVSRTTRVFKLRGIGMKFLKYFFTFIIGFEATDRMLERVGIKLKKELKDPKEMTRYQLMDEVRTRRKSDTAWCEWYEAHCAFLREYHAAYVVRMPSQPGCDKIDKDTSDPDASEAESENNICK